MPGNIAEFFSQHLSRPDHVLYRHFVDERWRDVTVAELAQRIACWQGAFRREGFVAGDRVAVVARNSINWVAIDLAALGLGLVVVPLYVDDNADNVVWCVAHAEARLLIVENSRIAAGLRKCAESGPPLPTMIVLRPDPDEAAMGAERFVGAGDRDVEVQELAGATLATICFTSGTSGRPKGVMLSHGNIIANVDQCRAINIARPDDRFLSILPLSHMFERTGGYYLPLSLGALVAIARGLPQIPDDLVSQRPTAMFAVPRIFERFRMRIEQSLAESPLRRALFLACVERGTRIAAGRGTVMDKVLAGMLRQIVGRPILARMGGCLRLTVVGGAPLDPDLGFLFIALGLPMLQGYGMTEASPVVAVNRLVGNDPRTVGPPLPGVETRIGASGELLVRGPNVMLGYWRNDAATHAAIDSDGWLHTGDLAEMRGESVAIRGRSKDIVVMSNGEKISPQDVEIAVMHDPVFEQAMLIGEGRPYPVMLAVTELEDEKELVKRVNQTLKAFPRWARVRHVIVTMEPWTVDNGLLTPTLKLRRPALMERYKDEIEQAYRAPPVE